jgi:hypothetical protein
MRYLISGMLIVAGLIHLIPISGVVGAGVLSRLYGVPIDDPSLVVLMRHRAVMFGLLGAMLMGAAWRPDWQWAAVVAGLISAASFITLAWHTGGYNDAVARVVMVDWVAVAALLIAALALALQAPNR